MSKKIIKFWVFFSVAILLINQLTPVIVFADELLPTPTTDNPDNVTVLALTQAPTPTIDVSPTPTSTLPDTTVTTTPEPTNTEGPTTTPELTPTLLPTIIISTDSQTTASTDVGSSSDSGQNQATGDSENSSIVVNSGNATAVANLVNIVNSNSVGSRMGVYILNNFDGNLANLDLNQLWQQVGTGDTGLTTVNGDISGSILVINNTSSANVLSQVGAVANSGQNQIGGSGGLMWIDSGNAYALANLINFINTNLVGSTVMIGIINVDAKSLGNLVLPNPGSFSNGNGGGEMVTVNSQNQGAINNTAVATSTTGGNQTNNDGSSTITTGNATSMVNSYTVVNSNLVNSNQFILGINTLGNWDGNVVNFDGPGSITPGQNTIWLQLSGGGGAGNYGSNQLSNLSSALVTSQVTATANTGGNTINGSGNAAINTGNAYALSNLANFVNMNMFGSRLFFGMINVVGNWNGNAVFAYPDMKSTVESLSASARPGDKVGFKLRFRNEGYEGASSVVYEIDLPTELTYVEDNSGIKATIGDRKINWNAGKVGSFKEKEFEVWTEVNSHTTASGGIIGKVWASDNYKDVSVQSKVVTPDAESDLSNNLSFAKVKIEMSPATNTGISEQTTVDERLPTIVIQAKNNVVNPVLRNDIVTFEVGVENRSDVAMQNSYLIHNVYNDMGEQVKTASLKLGNIGPNKKGKIHFGVKIDMSFEVTGQYYSQTRLVGTAQNGTEVESNVTETSFGVNITNLVTKTRKGSVLATEKRNNILLADASTIRALGENLTPFLLLFAITSIWLLAKTQEYIVLTKKR